MSWRKLEISREHLMQIGHNKRPSSVQKQREVLSLIKEHRTGSLSSRAGGSQPGGGRGCLTDSPLRAEFSRPRRKWHRCPRWQCHVQPLCTQPTATILDSDVTSEEKGSWGIRRVLLKGGTLVCEASARDPYKQVKWTKFKGGKKRVRLYYPDSIFTSWELWTGFAHNTRVSLSPS